MRNTSTDGAAIITTANELVHTESKRAAPLTIEILRQICDSSISKRDRALLTVGFAGALRRSEIVNLNWDDVHFVAEGIMLHLQGTKTDRERNCDLSWQQRKHLSC
jgi:integrase